MSKKNSITVEWYDDLVSDSYKLVLPKYHLECLKAEPIENGTCITVFGEVDDIDSFFIDFEDDAFEVLDEISLRCEDDSEYINSVINAIDALSSEYREPPEVFVDHVEM